VPIFRPIVEASWKYVARQAILAPPSTEAKRQLVMLPVDLRSGTRVAQGGQGTITEAFRTDGRGRLDDTQYRIVSEADAQLRIEGDQYGETQYPDSYRSAYGDRQNPDGYYYRYYGGPRGGAYGATPQSPYQQPQYNRGLFGSWSSQPPPQPQPQPQRRIDPDYFWHNRIN
jgi:penicillin-binding protein 1A